MHERYILPALALLFFAFVETGDRSAADVRRAGIAASAVNIGVVLAFDYLIAPNTGLGYVIGAVQLAVRGADGLYRCTAVDGGAGVDAAAASAEWTRGGQEPAQEAGRAPGDGAQTRDARRASCTDRIIACTCAGVTSP